MVTMVATIANGGTYIQPRIVKQIIDSETGEVTDVEVKEGERVISEETAKNVLSMMESVVAEGTGKNSQVKGYRIGGKTGTSEDGVNTGKYVTSFIGVAPISDPSVAVLITLYNPTGEGGHQGGGVAAPIGAQIFGEVLPYLEIEKDNEDTESNVTSVEVPDVVGLTIKDASNVLKENNLVMNIEDIESIDKENTIVKLQVPSSGVVVNSGSNVYLEY